jgi:hypothetical protein
MKFKKTADLSCLLLLCALLYLCGAKRLWGQEEWPQVLAGQVYMDRESVVPGCDLRLVLEARIEADYHINSHAPGDEFLIPTEIKVKRTNGFSFDTPIYPAPLERMYQFSDEKMSVYEGTVHFGITGRTTADLEAGQYGLELVFSYQPCDHVACYPPEEVVFPLAVRVLPLGQEMKSINETVMAKVDWEGLGSAAEKSGPEDEFTQLVKEKGLMLALLIVFVGGHHSHHNKFFYITEFRPDRPGLSALAGLFCGHHPVLFRAGHNSGDDGLAVWRPASESPRFNSHCRRSRLPGLVHVRAL